MNNSYETKKAQGLPINIVVMLIIGIVLFGLGFGLFARISDSGNTQVEEWNEKIKTGITSLECKGEEWICSPAYEVDNGERGDFSLYIANRGDENTQYRIEFNGLENGFGDITKDTCGSIELEYPTMEINVKSTESAKIPFIVRATKVTKTPCSFIGTVRLIDENDADFQQKTAVIIKVQ